jgi:hypothetical protein
MHTVMHLLHKPQALTLMSIECLRRYIRWVRET